MAVGGDAGVGKRYALAAVGAVSGFSMKNQKTLTTEHTEHTEHTEIAQRTKGRCVCVGARLRAMVAL
jgi:hypothetical protein